MPRLQWLIGCNGSSVATAVRSPVNENVLGLKKCSEPLPWDGSLTSDPESTCEDQQPVIATAEVVPLHPLSG